MSCVAMENSCNLIKGMADMKRKQARNSQKDHKQISSDHSHDSLDQ